MRLLRLIDIEGEGNKKTFRTWKEVALYLAKKNFYNIKETKGIKEVEL